MADEVEGRPLEEAELVDRARHGDVEAYGELVDRYRPVAFRAAYLVAGNAADAEDAAQEAFVKAYYALGRFRAEAAFRPWLLRIVTNEARNRRRSAGRRERLALRLSADRRPGDAAPSPEAAVMDRAMKEAILVAVSELREIDRIVIAYRYFLDLSEAETADVLGVRRGTVKSRLNRALARLRERLPEGARPSGMEAVDG
ncbi:MAG TPA: sigma-70 family RNA polymerase sigma factor [Actinomycetota bacterium]